MKILIITQRFYPDSFRVNDMASTLAAKGHDVTVLTGMPLKDFKKYKKSKQVNETYKGAKVVRVKDALKRDDIIGRFLNYYSFSIKASMKVKKLDSDFDVVLMNELSPIMSVAPAIKYKRKYKAKIVMYEMDLWPESLLAGGIKQNSLIYKYYKKVSGSMYSRCDKILVSTKEHIEYIKRLPGCSNVSFDYLPQYAEKCFINKNNFKLKSDCFNLMFAGNIGKAQDCETIVNAAKILKDNKTIKFHIIGVGSEKEYICNLIKENKLDNIVIYDPRPVEEMPKLYEKMDAMLVTLTGDAFCKLTIPGKVQSYLASGKPIISACDGATNELIKESGVGLICNSSNSVELALNCKKISEMSNDELIEMQKKSIETYFKYFDENHFFEVILDNLNKYATKH